MSKQDLLQAAINSATNAVYMTSKEQVVDYYRDTYGRVWKQKLVHDLAPIANMKPKNLERRFDPSRIHNEEKRNAEQYKTLGQQLPPIRRELKAGQTSITITVKGDMHQGPRGGTEPLAPNATFSGSDAFTFINSPNFDDIYEDYGMDADLLNDGDYVLDVGSVSAV